jgi:hemoglobin/transferrin/lactoferrin receptor protein
VIDKPLIADSLYQKDNVGKARLYGFDLGVEYNLLNKIVLFASASFVRGEDTDNKTDLPQIPPFNGRIGFKTSMLKYVSVEIASTFFAEQNKVAFGETKTPGYVLFDLYLSSMPIDFGFMDFKLFTGVENILDKDYRNHLSTNRGSIRSEPGRNFFIRTTIAL